LLFFHKLTLPKTETHNPVEKSNKNFLPLPNLQFFAQLL
jgi:hypothetical protein